jgi:hypothetical protein
LKAIERLIGFQILEDGRQPDPLKPGEKVADGDAERPSSGGKNRRQRRIRGPRRAKGAGEAQAKSPSGEAPAKARPTAADRKNARNRRRRKTKKSGE